MHVTLHFFGETDHASVAALRGVVRAIANEHHSPEVHGVGLAGYPRFNAARCLVLTLDGVDLLALGRAVEQRLGELGFSPSSRPWQPHLTIARVTQSVDLYDLVGVSPVSMIGRAIAITLYESDYHPGMQATPRYEIIERASCA